MYPSQTVLYPLFPTAVKSWFWAVFLQIFQVVSRTGAQAVCFCRNLLKLLLEMSGYWRPHPAEDLCTRSEQIKCRSLVMLKKILFIFILCTGLNFIFQVFTSFSSFYAITWIDLWMRKSGCWWFGSDPAVLWDRAAFSSLHCFLAV